MTVPGVSAAATARPRPDKTRIAFIDIGRAIGALLVVYSHIHVVWMQLDHGISAPVTDAVSAAFTSPLHLVGQDLGQLGVPFFFLASGFVVTPIALRQGHARFAVNRIFRIYPLLAFAILLAAGAILIGLHPIETVPVGAVTPMTVLTNITLVNYVIHPQMVLLGVTWTLAVEVIFYLLLISLLPVFRRAPWLAIALQLMLIEAVMLTRHEFGPSYAQFAFSMALTTLPIIGQIIWAGHTGRLSGWVAAGYVGVAWWMFVWAKDQEVGHIEAGYPTAVALAILLFLLGLFGESHIMQRRAWTFLSERTYSIYLMHGITVFVVLDALYGRLPLWLAVVLALAVTAGAVEVSYKLVERPSTVLGRSVARSLRGPGQTVSSRLHFVVCPCRRSGGRHRLRFTKPGCPRSIHCTDRGTVDVSVPR
ncbi:MAG TPA: acyltransferase [Pseudonocardiaceae bacterium]|nr:acyltransferase [Pseudonocardiaceae bacterium]